MPEIICRPPKFTKTIVMNASDFKVATPIKYLPKLLLLARYDLNNYISHAFEISSFKATSLIFTLQSDFRFGELIHSIQQHFPGFLTVERLPDMGSNSEFIHQSLN